MDLYSLPERATGFSFKKFNLHIMGLCLTYHVNLKLSTRQTAHALKEVHGIDISHTMVANYALTAAAVIKPFVDTFDYKPSNILSADETYIKVKGIKHYVWIVMDACKKSILEYQVSDTRAVGPCILAMRMAFDKFKNFPNKTLKFIADGYSAYPLAKQQFELEEEKIFDLTQVIGLTNDDPVSTEFRWVKQVVERLNRTFKSSYRVTCGYSSDDGALYGFSLWTAYYNFLRPHPYNYWKPLNELKELEFAENMPAKWQILISLGQQTILQMQESDAS
uniref:DDE-type integrase/transposase/recombinase n=1 Tax=Inconstantimicrobium porci TaxID=2652291 RepID=UPI0012B38AE0|nr:DDE-type integrase/transposase/recombinase [Inconstantimicrobium porci]